MRIISLALRQRIFGSIRTEGTCTLWCGDPKDALIFRGKKHQVYEITFYLFSPLWKLSKDDIIHHCRLSEICISPHHLSVQTKTHLMHSPWERLEIGLEDRGDIVNLHKAGVSKRTLKQWYMLETKELDSILIPYRKQK